MDAGVTRQAYGGRKVGEMLNQGLMLKRFRFFTDVEWLLVRYALEKVNSYHLISVFLLAF